MTDKSLKSKAIKIKGKDYVLVSDRVTYFNEQYPNGAIDTQYKLTDGIYHVKASVIPNVDNPARIFTGLSQAVIGEGMVNKIAALENAETSAVGRALGFMGIGVIESIASADEMNKATTNTMRFATEKQIQWLRDTVFKNTDQVSEAEVDDFIESILTVKPQQVPVYKVKDAVDKITASFKEALPKNHIEGEVKLSKKEVDEAINDLKEGKIPF